MVLTQVEGGVQTTDFNDDHDSDFDGKQNPVITHST